MDTRQAEIGDKIHFAVMAIEASAKEMSPLNDDYILNDLLRELGDRQ